MKCNFLKLALSSAILMLTTAVNAGIIIDHEIEAGNGWNNTGWYDVNGGFFSQDTGPATEGGQSTHINSLADVYRNVSHADLSFGSQTLQEGTYTISFAAGNFNNLGFPDIDIMFAGLNINDAISSSSVIPESGHFELWSFTWDVSASNSNIGNALSFNATATGTGSLNASFDGVGAMSDLGNGFLVDYTAVPEPSTLAIFALGIMGFASRRFKK
jgi:hypothetical protein